MINDVIVAVISILVVRHDAVTRTSVTRTTDIATRRRINRRRRRRRGVLRRGVLHLTALFHSLVGCQTLEPHDTRRTTPTHRLTWRRLPCVHHIHDMPGHAQTIHRLALIPPGMLCGGSRDDETVVGRNETGRLRGRQFDVVFEPRDRRCGVSDGRAIEDHLLLVFRYYDDVIVPGHDPGF